MSSHRVVGAFRSILVAALVLLGTSSAGMATDGHFLHGVGAVNASMGGAGVAAPVSLLGTFYLNPAGLMAFDGTRFEFGFEMFKPDRTVASDATGIGFGAGETVSKSEYVPIPAMGVTTKLNSGRVVLGISGLGIGGFGVDYPSSTTNPISAPQPFGFGQVYSNYSLLKIAPAVSWAATDKLWIGGAVNISWASLAVQPAAFAPPTADPASGTAFYPSAAATDGAFGGGVQLGLLYNFSDMFAFGAAYTSEQWFQEFEWNSSFANPNLPTFGAPQELTFKLNVPPVAAAGIALYPLPNFTIAADFRYMWYESTEGFKIPDEGIWNPDGSVNGFGWQNIYAIGVGFQIKPVDVLALRAGYHFSQNPIPDELSFINVPAPGIVQNHITFGLGFQVTRKFDISLGYYKALENSGTGPFLNPGGDIPGTSVTNSLSESSIQLQFSYTTRGRVY